jgi:dephospho-CoA kinase
MAKVVGITGGIGTGKSTVCRLFATLGIPCLQADLAANELMHHNPTIIANIQQLFGSSAYSQGKLNKKYIAEQVFGNELLLAQLNQLVHPAVQAYTISWAAAQAGPYCLYEAALIGQKHKTDFLDALIWVTAPMPLRIARIHARDARNNQQIEKIIANQPTEAAFAAIANYTIHNNEQQALIPQVLAIHQQLLELA